MKLQTRCFPLLCAKCSLSDEKGNLTLRSFPCSSSFSIRLLLAALVQLAALPARDEVKGFDRFALLVGSGTLEPVKVLAFTIGRYAKKLAAALALHSSGLKFFQIDRPSTLTEPRNPTRFSSCSFRKKMRCTFYEININNERAQTMTTYHRLAIIQDKLHDMKSATLRKESHCRAHGLKTEHHACSEVLTALAELLKTVREQIDGALEELDR